MDPPSSARTTSSAILQPNMESVSNAIVTSDPVLARITRALVERYHPIRIVLFGSRARGDATGDSDYDLMVEVDEAERAKVEAEIDFFLFDQDWDVDPIVKTPAQYAEECDDVGLLAYQIEREGVVVYAREGAASVPMAAPKRVREPRRASARTVGLWIKRAENDYHVLAHHAAYGDYAADVVCFHAHQSAEKYIKAVIVSLNCVPPRTHRLGRLLKLCPERLLRDRDVGHSCAVLLVLFRLSRYPDVREPTADEARAAVAAAGVVRGVARGTLAPDVKC